jgi:protocatechuate 4,5-dioxygenase, beta chain
MAEIVGVLGVTHNPLMWSSLRDPLTDDLVEVAANFERLRARVAELGPDVIVMVASDHFHMLMTWNMPAFMIGRAPEMRAGHPNEKRVFGLESAIVRGDPGLGSHLLSGGDVEAGFDFAFSDEPWLDHSFLVPLLLLNPELDIPVVPVLTNCNAPPIPTSRRFAQLGTYLAGAIDSFPEMRRVLVVGSGHLAVELGGPRQFLGASPDPEFDAGAVSWMAEGALESAVDGTGYQRLTEAGNETYQFLNYITCLAVVGGRPATLAQGIATRFGNLPFFSWEAM